MAEDNDSKTELPSEKRLHDAMEKGQFAKSPEVGVVLMLLAALGVFSLTVGTAAREVGAMAVNVFSSIGTLHLQLDSVPAQLAEVFIVLAKVLGPIIGACVLAAFLAGGIQSGFNLTPETFGIKFENLSLTTGFQRICSKRTFVHAGVDAMKVVAIALALWTAARGLMEDPLFSAPIEAAYLGTYFSRTTTAFLSRLSLALGIIAAISYWYEFLKSRRDLMMSRQEIKEEQKQTQGDALTKGAMRRMARRLLQKQMLEQVATADVVVTNPTHYAVALRYERGVDQAPVVLAKGENRFAQRIKAMAAQHGVPTIENKPVARMLFALGRVDEAIPSELYQAVAEILAFVYRTHRYYFYELRTRRAALSGQKPGSKKTVVRGSNPTVDTSDSSESTAGSTEASSAAPHLSGEA